MTPYEGKPGKSGKPEPSKLKRTASNASSNISNSDDSLSSSSSNYSNYFVTLSSSNEDVDYVSTGGEDGIVLHLHDISYMREAVKQPDYENNYEDYYREDNLKTEETAMAPRRPVFRFQLPTNLERFNENLRRNRHFEFAETQTSYTQLCRRDSQVNLLLNTSVGGSNNSLYARALAAEEANNIDETPSPEDSAHEFPHTE